jgi:phosphoribosylaminoimidazole carboxylase (NCAIR synthetase)
MEWDKRPEVIFSDKLAMRVKAQSEGIPVPAFSALFNDEEINEFADTVDASMGFKTAF